MQKYNIFTSQQSFNLFGLSYFSSSFKKEWNKDCNIDSKTLKSMAIQMLLTEKPSINLSANRMISAFTTSINNPNVTMVIGKVKITKKGFTKRFNKDKTTATRIAVV